MSLVSSESVTRDNLFSAANQVQPIVTMEVTVVSGAGSLARGTVLAASCSQTHDVAKADSKWTVTENAVEIISVAKKSAPTTAIAAASNWSVARNANGGLEISAIGEGALDGVTENLLVTVLTNKPSGKLNKLGASGGYLIPVCILDKAVDATSADKVSAAYFSGEFNANKLVVASGVSLSDYTFELAKIGIYAK